MTILRFSAIALFVSLLSACITPPDSLQEQQLDLVSISDAVSVKLQNSIIVNEGLTKNPREIEKNGEVRNVASRDWTSGFYPGILWYAWELYGDSIYLNAAKSHTLILEKEKLNDVTHDMGFKMYCSYGNGYRLTNNSEYRDILIESAYTLITRFTETTGCIRSWDHNADKWDYPVIIDNMMNLELLFWAFRETDDSIFYNIVVSHADKTLENHFREDNSSFHVVDYDVVTGDVMNKQTHQGYSDSSAWSRGQAWGFYGYTMMYRETKDEKYLEQAVKIMDFFFDHPNLPEDLVPYWDMNAPGIPDEPRDVSAAAIFASGLYELGNYTESDKSKEIFAKADKIMTSLSSEDYFCSETAEHTFLLDHSTGNKNKDSAVDVPIIYADYYFIEALIRRMK